MRRTSRLLVMAVFLMAPPWSEVFGETQEDQVPPPMASEGQPLERNYVIRLQLVENKESKLDLTFVTGADRFQISEPTTDAEWVTFIGTLSATNDRSVFLDYHLGIRDSLPNKKTYADSGVKGGTYFELRKPVTVFSTSSRAFHITVNPTEASAANAQQ